MGGLRRQPRELFFSHYVSTVQWLLCMYVPCLSVFAVMIIVQTPSCPCSSLVVGQIYANIPTHSPLLATFVSQPSTAQRSSLMAEYGSLPAGARNPTPARFALVGRRFSKHSAQYT